MRANDPKAVLGDETELLTFAGRSHSLVSLVGPSYSIAEVGEQIAWLVAATSEYSSSGDGGVILGIPSISMTGTFHCNSYPATWASFESLQPLSSTISNTGAFVAVEIEVLGSKKLLQGKPAAFWGRLLGYSSGPPIIQRYPTARRREGCPGLELSYDMLQVARSTGFGQSTALKESFAALVLAGASKGVFYWHEPHSCRCSTELFLEAHGDSIPSQPPSDALKGARHVICDCELYMETGEHHPSQVFYLLISWIEGDTTPSASTSTSSTSLTGVILSVSSDSVNIIQQDRVGPGFCFFKNVLQHIVKGYLRQAPSDGATFVGNAKALPSGTHSSTSNGDSSRQSMPYKRRRENKHSRGDEDENNLQPRKRLKGPPSHSLEKPRFLACPFWKLDPNKHWECFLKKLTTVSYVKQHLSRRHTPALYCQTCFAIFDDEALLESHILSRSCERDPLESLEGISTIQSRKLSQKSKGTTEEQWYAIWDILFPSESRPLSIYIDSDQSADFVLLREFSQREGVSILHDRIRATGRILRPDVPEQEVRDILRQALDSFFDYYRMNVAPVPAEPPQTRSRTSGDSRPQGVMADNRSTDSGVILTSHSSHGSRADDQAITSMPEDNNAGTPAIEAIESATQAQTDPVGSLQVLEAFNTDVSEDWGILRETESVFGGANLDELYDRLIVQGGMAELDGGLDAET